MNWHVFGLTIVALAMGACGESSVSDSAEADNPNIATAEALIDAFYSFDAEALRATLATAEDSIPAILYYQGWAEGGNYEILNRVPCVVDDEEDISCSITVKDDLIGALDLDVNVTDTFHLTFSGNRVVHVETSSNDPDAYYEAQSWVEENRPQLIKEPCRGFFAGGPTPGECVKAMVRGYAEFAANGGLSE